MMKRKLSAMSQQYVTVLKKHLKQGLRASPQLALELGRRAAVLGLKTQELARIHQQALTTLGLVKGKKGLLRRAEKFFARTLAPLAKIRRTALKTNPRLNQANQALN